MKQFEYLLVSPNIQNGKFIDGYTQETVTGKSFFGGEKTEVVFKEKIITEQQWLNNKGKEGWQLVSILRNSMSYDIKEYCFVREIQPKQ